jgi:hypothetical protein
MVLGLLPHVLHVSSNTSIELSREGLEETGELLGSKPKQTLLHKPKLVPGTWILIRPFHYPCVTINKRCGASIR